MVLVGQILCDMVVKIILYFSSNVHDPAGLGDPVVGRSSLPRNPVSLLPQQPAPAARSAHFLSSSHSWQFLLGPSCLSSQLIFLSFFTVPATESEQQPKGFQTFAKLDMLLGADVCPPTLQELRNFMRISLRTKLILPLCLLQSQTWPQQDTPAQRFSARMLQRAHWCTTRILNT